ncbi:hypothetical protein QE152_g22242 [Popillia japonica]|uniref:Double jelly roll-like domain-containing protein n=1 Tax=Popillia japonica TaxID=7064 RepID=A0AAW1KLD3_POPJA
MRQSFSKCPVGVRTSYGDNETKFLEMSGWCPNSKTQPTISLNNKFNAYIPLKFFLGFAEDYKKIIINASQELILLRSGQNRMACSSHQCER